MNKEELIGKLQMVYVGDRNALNELIGYYDGLKEVIEIVQQENKKYKEVIDKAIKYKKEKRKPYTKAKAVDKSCRNHGNCKWCEDNRTYKNRKREGI